LERRKDRQHAEFFWRNWGLFLPQERKLGALFASGEEIRETFKFDDDPSTSKLPKHVQKKNVLPAFCAEM
jgi:hypothetical protein